MTTITTTWLLRLVLSFTHAGICEEATVIDPPVASVVRQQLGPESAHLHYKTTSVVRISSRDYLVQTQETYYVIGQAEEKFVAFEVYIDYTKVPGGGPNLDVSTYPTPAWCSIPEGQPLHP